jgi:hypothetical protein
MTTAARRGQNKNRTKNEHICEIHDNPERTNTIGRTNACEIAQMPHDHDKAVERCHVRFKQDINPLSDIFDKSKATLIVIQQQTNAKNDAPDGVDLPPTKRKDNKRSANQQKKLPTALDPGNKILDDGEGKNNLRASFINNTTNMGSLPPKHTTASPTDTAVLLPGLAPPTLQTMGKPIKGMDRGQHRKENKHKQQIHQAMQPLSMIYWTTQKGGVELMAETTKRPKYRNSMCPTGLALAHPATPTLQEYATYRCPAKMGKPSTKTEIW